MENYPIWPGDKVPKSESKNNKFGKKRSRCPEEDCNSEAKRPAFMQNRYFSIENTEKIDKKEDIEELNNAIESKRFLERKDYLIKKLFQTRTLPNLHTTESNNIENDASSEVIETIQNEVTSKHSVTRKHSFQDDFIKLTNVSDNKNNENDQHIQPVENKRFYPQKCLNRVKQYLIETLKQSSSGYSDRVAEITKIKINIKSRFDNDQRLLRRIKRDTDEVRQIIDDRLEFLEKKRRQHSSSAQHIRFNKVESSESSDDCVIYEKDTTNKNRKKIQIKYIKLDDDDEYEENDTDNSDNESDVIKMINEQETYLNVSDNDTKDSNVDIDSKCYQIGNKFISKKTGKRIRKNSKNEMKKNHIKLNASRKEGKNAGRADSAKRLIDSQLEEMEENYKKIRNQRNKMLKKKKGVEINIQRGIMSDQLKVIRRNLKKLRRKRNSMLRKSTTQNYNSDFNSNSVLFVENRKPIKNKYYKSNFKNRDNSTKKIKI